MGLGSALASAASAGTLKELIKVKLRTEETIRPMGKDDWLRVSSLPSICAREEVLVACKSIPRTDTTTPDFALTFAHGHAIHHALQNDVLPELGIVFGTWQCLGCGTKYGSKYDRRKRPTTCTKCDSVPLQEWEKSRAVDGQQHVAHEFRYIEEWYGDEQFRIGGHPDAFIQLAQLPDLGVLEGKSISPRQAPNVKHTPDVGHVVQLQVYLWLTGLKWGKILYWDKGAFGMSSLIEHHVDIDEDVIAQVKELIVSIRTGIVTGKLPKRICGTSDCKRAGECAVSQLCFELPEEATVETTT